MQYDKNTAPIQGNKLQIVWCGNQRTVKLQYIWNILNEPLTPVSGNVQYVSRPFNLVKAHLPHLIFLLWILFFIFSGFFPLLFQNCALPLRDSPMINNRNYLTVERNQKWAQAEFLGMLFCHRLCIGCHLLTSSAHPQNRDSYCCSSLGCFAGKCSKDRGKHLSRNGVRALQAPQGVHKQAEDRAKEKGDPRASPQLIQYLQSPSQLHACISITQVHSPKPFLVGGHWQGRASKTWDMRHGGSHLHTYLLKLELIPICQPSPWGGETWVTRGNNSFAQCFLPRVAIKSQRNWARPCADNE